MNIVPIPVVELEFLVAIVVVLLLGWRFVAAGHRADLETEVDPISRGARVFRRCCVVLAGLILVSIVLLLANFEPNQGVHYYWTGRNFSSKSAFLTAMTENKNRFHDGYGNTLLDGVLNEPCVPGDSSRLLECESRSQEELLASVRQESSSPNTYAITMTDPLCGTTRGTRIWAAPGIVEIRVRCGK